MSACVFEFLGLIRSRVGITKAAVFPVPFLARARMSLPVRATGMASSCIGDGFSKPASKMPINSSFSRQKSSKSRPFVAVTSCNSSARSIHDWVAGAHFSSNPRVLWWRLKFALPVAIRSLLSAWEISQGVWSGGSWPYLRVALPSWSAKLSLIVS